MIPRTEIATALIPGGGTLGAGPSRVKGIGEAGMLGVAALIANAIQDATGASITAIPFTPEQVLDALDRRSPR